MESSSGGWRGGADRHQEPEPPGQAGTPKALARALRSLAEQTRRQAGWVRVRSGAAIDHASVVESQHRALSHGFGSRAPQPPPPESGSAGAGTPAEVARTLQLRAE